MNKFSPFSIKRAVFLNITVHPLSISELNDFIAQVCAANRRGCIIANHNLHSVYLAHRDEAMASFYSLADRIHIDGMGVVLLGRLCGVPLQRSMRVTYVDWLPHLLARAAKESWKVFYLGSRPGVAEGGAQRFKKMFPALNIRSHHGYFDMAAESGRIIDLIQAEPPNACL
jgi:N-acetylglucosaminyldiphosphoundecaprenol N-acetyl-beta-D-mannosaminyltransferase